MFAWLFLSTGVFAIVGGLFSWGEGWVFSQENGRARLVPMADLLVARPIETDFNNAAIRNNPQMKSFLGSITALGRVGEADDIGSIVAAMCSDAMRWVNGQRIEASGGINL